MDSIEENSKEFLSSKYSKTQTSKSQSQIQEEIEKKMMIIMMKNMYK